MSGISCDNCGKNFTYNESYYRKMGFKPPKRCESCRELRKDFFRTLKQLKVMARKLSINNRDLINKLKQVLE